jgi:hypothetical protein
VTAILDWLCGFLNKKSAAASSVPDAAREELARRVPTPLFRQQSWAGLRLYHSHVLIAHVDGTHTRHVHGFEDVAVYALGTRRCPIHVITGW